MIIIEFGSLILILLLLVAIARGTRRRRRVPCAICGEALLPAARHCRQLPRASAVARLGRSARAAMAAHISTPERTFRHPAGGQRIPFLSPIIGVGFGAALGIAPVVR